ncbi:PTS IIA-like nitrogen regulatory protein PtsN [Thalassolituus marinus]|uniref:PTS IIA-like nitrogen regulatory protein PtsN n=1 Tax=Thalassolituus marinus TaxID=671053 RepID=A0ABS7ZNZ9_9GAMM|nr:PTS IIA-like nitrogen regulatory protein PtsN [Thalassolituus marinus]MCA6063431.1 PTS IIA-like nitrogen regulatory protein PtsN [Thalassolituus marinus]
MTIGIEDILTPERALLNVAVTSKKKLLEFLAGVVTEQLPGSTADDIFDRLLSRERLGSTGIGEGIAIPHCRLRFCEQAIGILMKLDEPVDFDSIDGKPVDLVFALLVPEEATEEHLQILAMLAENFSNAQYREALRNAPDTRHLYQRALSGK